MLYVSPMSIEICEVVAELHNQGLQVGFTATVNQIGPRSYTGFRKPSDIPLMFGMRFERDHLEDDIGTANAIEIVKDDAACLTHEVSYGCQVDGRYDTDAMLDALASSFDMPVIQCGPGERGRSYDAQVALYAAMKHDNLMIGDVSAICGRKIGLNGSLEFTQHNDTNVLRSLGRDVRIHNSDYWLQTQDEAHTHYNIGPELASLQSAVYIEYEIKKWLSACSVNHKQRQRWCSGDASLETVARCIGHYHYDCIPRDIRDECANTVRKFVGIRLLQILDPDRVSTTKP